MNIGDIIKTDITDMNERGVGIAKVDGAVFFVPETVTHDVIEARIVSKEKNYYVGECVGVVSPSEYRTVPVCADKKCGGCTLSHISYELENRIKNNTVRSAFRRAGLDYSLVEDTVCSEARTAYRNKITVHYSKETNAFGLYADKTNDVLPFSSCAICPDSINELVRFTNDNIDLLRDCAPISLSVRTAANDAVAVSLYCEKKCDASRYVSRVASAHPNVCGVNVIVNGKGGGYIGDEILGINMRFSSEAFRQINKNAFEKLLGIVHSFAEESDFTCGADLYCGSGVIGLTLAKRFPKTKFYGIEINSDAIKDAKFNAAANEIDNIEFFCGDSATFKNRVGSNCKPELIVVDPPRAGLSKEMRAGLTELAPERIIYVSCNPQTMARDLASLKDSGYEIRRAVPVNMFPMTSHCETVVLLSRENKSPFEKLDKTTTPLLYRAAQTSVYGQRYEFESGSVTDAMFVYLDGSPSPKSTEALDRDYRLRPLACLTGAWEQFIKQTYPNAHVCNRYMMKPACQFLTDEEIALPDGFQVALFDEKAFALRPFSHGENYPSFAEFQEHGAGAVVWHNGKIVASASSFITVNDEIELDVSTEEAYRGKGLASACISLMLQDCEKRRIIVHWDAQNEASLHLAEKFGFERACTYSVYFLPKRITDECVVSLERSR